MELELPDGKTLTLPDGATGADAAAAIGPGLARAALAVKVDGELRDLARPLPENDRDGPAKLEILTDRSGEEALSLIRHDAAHVLAAAVIELYPGVKISIGPADRERLLLRLRFPRGRLAVRGRLRADRGQDARAHRRRRAVRARGRPGAGGARAVSARGPGLQGRADRGPRTRTTASPRRVSLYTNGPFTDLCRGPHAPVDEADQGVQAAVGRRRLLARGLEQADAHARSTGPRSSPTRTSQEYLERARAGARARPSQARPAARPVQLLRRRARDGVLVPAGNRRCSTSWWRSAARWAAPRGYTEVKTPQLYDSSLWKTSGHWDKYREHMFLTESADTPDGRSSR